MPLSEIDEEQCLLPDYALFKLFAFKSVEGKKRWWFTGYQRWVAGLYHAHWLYIWDSFSHQTLSGLLQLHDRGFDVCV